jgi:outer membrane biosynthesis protein TonB
MMKPGVQEQLPTVEHDNQESRALDSGGLSFNTYNWNFAPYMLELKRRIQRNIHPPAAFMYLGLISGETLVRFKIYPNGQMQDFQVLDYRGHKSLMITSVNAVEVSAPFPLLPPDFPEPYLEVTGKFIYFVGRNEKTSRK